MKIFWIISIGWVVFLFVALCGQSEARNVTYLPRDQELQTVSVNYTGSGYKLGELPCTAGGNGTKLDRSMACVGVRLDCPDCCLDWTRLDVNGRPTMRSTPVVTVTTPPSMPYYNQTELLFNSNDGSGSNVCPAVRDCTSATLPFPTTNCLTNWVTNSLDIPRCQELGCPGVDGNLYINAQPFLLSAGNHCQQVGPTPDKWICSITAQRDPAFPGCTQLSHVYSCTGDAFKITPATATECHDYLGLGPAHACAFYEFSDSYKACIETCVTASQGFERYERDTDCLLKGDSVCHDSTLGPGFLANCVTDQCQERIDWPECKPPLGSPTNELCCDNEALTPEKILEYQQAYSKCFDHDTRGGGGCLDCFQPLGTNAKPLQYDFVARSNQKMLVIWQLQVTPHYCLTTSAVCPSGHLDVGTVPTSYLYTTAKVFDITDGNETQIFPGASTKGTLSQRAFAAAFSIFAATAVDKQDDGTTNFLEQGHRYRVKLYWYIPTISNAILTADVLWAQLTVIKTRD